MIPLKALLPALLAASCLTGCVYDEYDQGYAEPPRHAYRGGYVDRDVVVVHSHPDYYYEERPRYYYGGRQQYFPQDHRRAYYQPGYPANRSRYPGGGYASYNPQRYNHDHDDHDRDRDRDRDNDNDNDHGKKKSGDSQKKKPSQSPTVGARNNTRVVLAPSDGPRSRPTADKKKKKKDDD